MKTESRVLLFNILGFYCSWFHWDKIWSFCVELLHCLRSRKLQIKVQSAGNAAEAELVCLLHLRLHTRGNCLCLSKMSPNLNHTFPYSLSDFNNGFSEWERDFKDRSLWFMYNFPVFLPRTSITRSDTHVMFLLVEQMYMQVGINSFLTALLASFIYYCKIMLEKSSWENETCFYSNVIYLLIILGNNHF